MGISGAGLYDDDTAADVRGRYRELVADGATGIAATDALLTEWREALDDADDAAVIWLALADTQSKIGRLEERVRARAMALLESGEGLSRFEHDPQLLRQRRQVLRKLVVRLTGPPRPPVKLRKPFRSVSPVGFGDVFWFTLPSSRRVLLRCVGVSGDERDNYPTVEVLDWIGPNNPPNGAELFFRVGLPNASGKWPDLLSLVRYPRDPDPAAQVEVIWRGASVTRTRAFPSIMVPWTRIEDDLARLFGV